MNNRDLVSTEAEYGVLGALMHKPDLCDEVGAFLSADAFHSDDNAMIYNLILSCHARKIKPDSITLSVSCETLPSGEATIYVASTIMRDVPSAANALTYAKIVSERATARRLFAAGQAIMDMARSQGSLAAQVAQAQQSLYDLTIQQEEPDVVSYTDALGEVFIEMQDRLDGKKAIGLMFGLTKLDEIVQGLRPGNLVVVAGKPGTGKTVMGTGIADKICIREGKSALIFSLEMSKAELAKRALAATSGVSKNRIESGEALSNGEEKAKMEAAVHRMHHSGVRICEKPALTFSRICNIARFNHRASPLDLIVVDYLTLIRPDEGSRFSTRSAEIGSFTRGFKALAKELGIPIIILCQLNRAMDSRAGDARPKMSDLRDSGEIEQDADVIIMAYRDEKSEQGANGITEIDVVKCRHSKPGFCLLQFEGPLQRFVDVVNEDRFADQESPQEQRPRRESARSMINQYGKGGF